MPGHRPYRPFYARRKMPAAFFPVVITLLVSAFFLWKMTSYLMPVMETLAKSRAVNSISAAISEEADRALAAGGKSYPDFIDADTGPDGRITALSLRTAESNEFKREMVTALISRLEKLDQTELSVPLGNLTGILLFSNLGPNIRVSVQSVGDVTAQYYSDFTSAGVNQTRHSLYLDVTATVYLLMPGRVLPVAVEDRVYVAETVIVGEVPPTYLQFGAN